MSRLVAFPVGIRTITNCSVVVKYRIAMVRHRFFSPKFKEGGVRLCLLFNMIYGWTEAKWHWALVVPSVSKVPGYDHLAGLVFCKWL